MNNIKIVWFNGMVRIDPLFPAKDPARAAGNHSCKEDFSPLLVN
jgi:hypothetical protein